ncbi:hypothetical protein TrLO_g15147 [Triparma laevis f. longispina]|uniref:NECAP PHear domain-containing protein n=1 Tax=Triparma laevis f. longispina TaxID=1714387 RepID=A0A9W6ZS77_9STRA|nr:hypothetical protein TrLO_g15147 [Triparma laevis f. longispina]
MSETIERQRALIRNAHVFKLPPRSSSAGWRGADWTEEVWQGLVKVVEREGKCAIILVSEEGVTFAVCPVKEGAVDRCVDSSRYFVLRIENAQGRHMFIGLAFNERNDAFDFNTALSDSAREKEAEKNPTPSFTGPSVDYSIKEGQKIKVAVPKIGSSKDTGGTMSAAAKRRAARQAGQNAKPLRAGGLLAPSSRDTASSRAPSASGGDLLGGVTSSPSPAPAPAPPVEDDLMAAFTTPVAAPAPAPAPVAIDPFAAAPAPAPAPVTIDPFTAAPAPAPAPAPVEVDPFAPAPVAAPVANNDPFAGSSADTFNMGSMGSNLSNNQAPAPAAAPFAAPPAANNMGMGMASMNQMGGLPPPMANMGGGGGGGFGGAPSNDPFASQNMGQPPGPPPGGMMGGMNLGGMNMMGGAPQQGGGMGMGGGQPNNEFGVSAQPTTQQFQQPGKDMFGSLGGF